MITISEILYDCAKFAQLLQILAGLMIGKSFSAIKTTKMLCLHFGVYILTLAKTLFCKLIRLIMASMRFCRSLQMIQECLESYRICIKSSFASRTEILNNGEKCVWRCLGYNPFSRVSLRCHFTIINDHCVTLAAHYGS